MIFTLDVFREGPQISYNLGYHQPCTYEQSEFVLMVEFSSQFPFSPCFLFTDKSFVKMLN